MRAMIFGATGLVGSFIYEQLLKDDSFSEVISVSRRALAAHPKVTHYKAQHDELEPLKELFDVDVIFFAVGTTIKKAGSKKAFREIDFHYPLKVAKLFKEANSKGCFITITAMGSDPQSALFYNKTKGELEEALSKLNLWNLIIVRPSLILGSREEFRGAEFIGQMFAKLFDPILGRVCPNYAGVDAKKIASKIIAASKEREAGARIIQSCEIKAIAI
jgi:uncharacterized protein YbjT (DUF2867 family)